MSGSGPTEASPGAGSLLERIDTLTEMNRHGSDFEVESELVELRHRAFPELAAASGGELPDVGTISPAETYGGLDDLELTEWTGEAVREKVLRFGCAYAPKAIPAERIDELVAGIDRAFDGIEASTRPDTDPTELAGSFRKFDPPGAKLETSRKFNHAAGAVWTADSPHMLFVLLETFQQTGITGLITDYFGERPAISVDKCTLRRVPGGSHDVANWHQDGAFLGGPSLRSLNVWMALSDCGVDAPGMDLVPKRLELARTGTVGANFDWTVAQPVVDEVRGDIPVVRPSFRAGDLLIFDHLFLHRTASDPTMSDTRYAIECWFFAPSHYPSTQAPVVV